MAGTAGREGEERRRSDLRKRRESEKGTKGSVVARERSLNHTLPGPPRGHKVPLFHRRLQQYSRRRGREDQRIWEGGRGKSWCPSKP